MLRKDRFQSPNAIDAGDLPPTRPPRTPRPASDNSAAVSEEWDSCSVSTAPTDERRLTYSTMVYDDARDSATDFLQDLKLDPPPSRGIPIEQFRDEEEPLMHDGNESGDDEEGQNGDYAGQSLSALEAATIARSYASNILPVSSSRGTVTFSEEEDAVLGSSKAMNDSWSSHSRRDLRLTAPPISDYDKKKHDSKPNSMYSKKLLLFLCIAPLVLIILVIVPMLGLWRGEAGSGSNEPFQNKYHSKRLLRTIEFLISHGISSRDSLSVLGTPQNSAATWMADVDPLQYDIPTKDMLPDDAYPFIQRYVLVLLYHSTGGSKTWHHNLGFLSQNHECSWFHSKQFSDARVYAWGVTCEPSDLKVSELLIPSNNLQGIVPFELIQLQHLRLLSLSHNALVGTLPNLAPLGRLEYLDFGSNKLSGTLPDWVGQLSLLKLLSFENNRLSGSLPESLPALTDLVTLDVQKNSIEGGTDVLNGLYNLKYLYLGDNELRGHMDEMFLRDLAKIEEIDASKNLLFGDALPQTLLEKPNLRVLDISHNALHGTLPPALLKNTVLEILKLGQNGFAGAIPTSLESFRSLTHLDLSLNQFSGTIPYHIVSMRNLTALNLGENQFKQGEFPAFLLSFSQLRELSLPRCNITDAIPSWIELMSNLEMLNLQGNDLNDTVPEELWELPKLSILLLADNALTGSLPQTMANIESVGKSFGSSSFASFLFCSIGNSDHLCF